MSKFKDRAEDEAARRDREDSDWYARQADLLFVDGATWATRQPPTDAEVEAAAQALCDITYGLDWPRLVDGWKNKPYPDFPHLVDDLRDQARKALLAAQKVRAGR